MKLLYDNFSSLKKRFQSLVINIRSCNVMKKMRMLGVALFAFFLLLNGQVSGQEYGLNLVSSDNYENSVSVPKQLFHFAPPEVGESNREILNKILSINVVGVPRDETLKRIAELANIRIAFSKDVAEEEWKKPVSIQYDQVTVLGALYATLENTGLRLTLTSPSGKGQLVVVNGSVSDFSSVEAVNVNPIIQSEQQDGYGIITGEVRDALRGETLPGANVVIQGTIVGVATDVDGRYTLRRVPAGNQVMEIRFMGYSTQQIPVTVRDGESLEQFIELEPDMIEGDEIFVEAFQRGQARALTRQRESVNIRAVVSAEQIDRFADNTIDGALQRIAGMGHGGTNIRGVGSAMTNVTMDGQRMGTTGAGSRSVDLGTISADMVADLEVIKVITPDMDADALAGVINVNTRRPIGGQRTFNARLGGGWNNRFVDIVGPSARASISYGDSPSDNFSYGMNFSYLRSVSSTESIRTTYETNNFGEGPVDVLTNLRPQVQFTPSERYGAGMQFTFQPTARSTFHVQGMFNFQDRERQHFEKRVDPQLGRYYTATQTGNGSLGQGGVVGFTGTARGIDHDFELTESDIHQYTFRASGRHLLQFFDMEYSLGWGHGRFKQDQYYFDFRSLEDYDYHVNIEDRYQPLIGFTYWSPPNWPDPNRLAFRSLNHDWDNHIDNEFRGNIDFSIPFSRGTFKVGSSALMSFKDGKGERYQQNPRDNVRIAAFDQALNRDWQVFGREHPAYQIPWLLDLHKARDWYYINYTNFQMDLETWAARKETSKYAAYESTYAGYGMITMKFGRFTFLGGARLEHSANSYEGRDGTIDEGGRFRGALDVSASNQFTNLFPNAQFVYAFGRFTNIRLAYSRAIGRPSFTQLSPQIMRNYTSQTLSGGNPNLKPMLANNLDLLFEHYFMNVGQFTVGLFYKELTDFVYRFSDFIGAEGLDGEGAYAGWRWTSFQNGDEATVYGLEISWQQNLDFLPGFLGNLGTYATYSYAQSISDVGRRDTDGNIIWAPLTGQRPHVANVGFDYSWGNFFTQVSYRWGAPSISSYGTLRWVPEIQLRERVYFDRYRDAANNMSLTLRYRITSNFRLWADANNLLNYRSIEYDYDRRYYPTNISLSGRTINVGIHYTF